MATGWQSHWVMYDHYGYAFLAVVGTGAAVLLVQRSLQHPRLGPWLASLGGVVPPFINVISVLFGLTLAFFGQRYLERARPRRERGDEISHS